MNGFTCGTFDLLHAGHILMLEECKSNCDYLIVGLQTDPTLDRPEKNKPVQLLFERYTQLKACKYIDEIVPYQTEAELEHMLRALPINIRFIGKDWKGKEYTGHQHTHYTVKFNHRLHSFSSSELRNRLV